MNSSFVKNIKEVKNNINNLEAKLNVKIFVRGNLVFYDGESYNEYLASLVFDAINFGFSAKKSLMLTEENFSFRIINIKKYTKRKLKDVISRIVGSHGRTKRNFSKISGCELLVSDGSVGIIGCSDSVESLETAIINLIRGSKTPNMYRYLERMNRERKKQVYN